MKLHDILIDFISEEEIEERLRFHMIRLNYSPIEDTDIYVRLQTEYWELSEFLDINNIHDPKLRAMSKLFFSSKSKYIPEPLKFLSAFSLLKVGPNQEYVFINW